MEVSVKERLSLINLVLFNRLSSLKQNHHRRLCVQTLISVVSPGDTLSVYKRLSIPTVGAHEDRPISDAQ